MINSRKCDQRIELTRIIKTNTNYFCDTLPEAYTRNINSKKYILSIYRNISDVPGAPDGILNSNIDLRVFYTPKNKKSKYKTKITRKFIHILK